MMKKMIFALVIVFSLSIAGCTRQVGEQEQNLPQEENPQEQISQPVGINLEDVSSDPPANIGNIEIPAPRQRSSEAKLIHDISLDLSKRLGLDISEVILVESVPVTWPNGGLGCPAEGVAYDQAEIEGYQITVEVNGKQYIYHSHGLETFIWCDQGIPIAPLE